MKAKPELTHARLCELLDYDPLTGVFRWRVSRGRVLCGDIAGCFDGNGYRAVRLDGVDYRAHRLAWFFVHAVWPVADIDHINRRRFDNRLTNLRDVSRAVNLANCVGIGRPRRAVALQ